MSDDMAGTPVEITLDDLNDPKAVADKVWLRQLEVDDPILWRLLSGT